MPKRSSKAQPWSHGEVGLIVSDYFAMLREELLGRTVNKAEHNRRLREHLDGRSKGSVELKHQNISAVLIGMGLPYIDGYKPMAKYQALLKTGIEEFLTLDRGYLREIEKAPAVRPTEPKRPKPQLKLIFETPPEPIERPDRPERAASTPWLERRRRRVDFARRDAENRKLGRLGERFGMEVEKRRLRDAGRDDLARRVEWVASSIGDGLGFDILSYNEADCSERFIEVKTTGLGKYFPFYVTETEVRCSEAEPGKFQLYRVFDFSRDPRVFVLEGSLKESCELAAVMWRGASRR